MRQLCQKTELTRDAESQAFHRASRIRSDDADGFGVQLHRMSNPIAGAET